MPGARGCIAVRATQRSAPGPSLRPTATEPATEPATQLRATRAGHVALPSPSPWPSPAGGSLSELAARGRHLARRSGRGASAAGPTATVNGAPAPRHLVRRQAWFVAVERAARRARLVARSGRSAAPAGASARGLYSDHDGPRIDLPSGGAGRASPYETSRLQLLPISCRSWQPRGRPKPSAACNETRGRNSTSPLMARLFADIWPPWRPHTTPAPTPAGRTIPLLEGLAGAVARAGSPLPHMLAEYGHEARTAPALAEAREAVLRSASRCWPSA